MPPKIPNKSDIEELYQKMHDLGILCSRLESNHFPLKSDHASNSMSKDMDTCLDDFITLKSIAKSVHTLYFKIMEESNADASD